MDFGVKNQKNVKKHGSKNDVFVRLRFSVDFGALLGRSWALLGRSWGALGRSWGALGALLGALGCSWGAIGRSWGDLGCSGGALGALLGRFWTLLERFLCVLVLLSHTWAALGHFFVRRFLIGFGFVLGGLGPLLAYSQSAFCINRCSYTMFVFTC